MHHKDPGNFGYKLLEQVNELAALDDKSRRTIENSQMQAMPHVVKLAVRAIDARQFAYSYRGFLVGAAAAATFERSAPAPHNYRVFHGANMKPADGGGFNVHAEQMITGRVKSLEQELGAVVIDHLAVVADVQPDQQSGLIANTLHPCGDCRTSFTDEDSPYHADTRVLSLDANLRHAELYTLGDLQRAHESQDQSHIAHTELEPATSRLELMNQLRSFVLANAA